MRSKKRLSRAESPLVTKSGISRYLRGGTLQGMNRAVLLVFVLVLIGVGLYVVWTRTSISPDTGNQEPVAIMMQSEPATYSESTDTYEIAAEYPIFGVEPVDAAVQEVVDKAIASFKAYPVDNPSADSVPKNSQDISYGTVYAGPDYVSVEILISEYTGGAHPNSVAIGVNVTPDGKKITLVDALNLIGKSLQQVAVEADAQLKILLGDAYFADGAAPIPDNYSTFLVDEQTVTFVFNPYQVGPYAAGPQEVVFQRVR